MTNDTDTAAMVERLQHCSGNTKDEYLHELAGRAAATIADLQARVESAESECLEQARIVGAGGERELALMARVRELEGVMKRQIADFEGDFCIGRATILLP